MSGSVEVQRVLILTCSLWLLAGASLGDPFWLVVEPAFAATAWPLRLGRVACQPARQRTAPAQARRRANTA